MGGIRGHSPWEALPVVLLVVITASLALRSRVNVLVTALASFAVIGLILGGVWLIDELLDRLRYGNLVILRDLAAAPQSDATTREAKALAHRITRSNSSRYSLALRGMATFVDAARGNGDVAELCRSVLFRHAPWSKDMERDIAAMRYRLSEGEQAAWLEWFLNVQVGWPEFADRVADVTMWALPRIPAPDRQALLLRALHRAAPRDSWRRLGMVLRNDLDALDTTTLTAYQREQLALIRHAEQPAS